MSPKHADISLTVERLWQFSLQYYSMRGVKDACLNLQNHFKGNVNLLLLLKWLDDQQVCFKDQDWLKVEECLGHSESLLHSYRDIRRRLKSHVPDALYRESLQFELQLERCQQSDLVDCINSLKLETNLGSPLTLRYCRQLGAEHLYPAFAEPIDNTANM